MTLVGAARTRARQKKLAGRVVLITGGSRGLGLALAREFASRGCRLALCARDVDELERARLALAAAGTEVIVSPCDISNRDSVAAMIEDIRRHYGRIDMLINNAGEIMVSPFENLDVADFERSMAVMFWGPLYVTLAALPAMQTRGEGTIVNVTSIGGKVSVPHLLTYSCAKAAAVAFSDGLRDEVRRFGIQVTTVIPGLMRTGSYVNANLKGDHVAEASWFGAAASLPLLTLSAEAAARRTVNAVCAGRSEIVLGLPAQVLAWAETLLPGLTAGTLRLTNALLPKGDAADHSIQVGTDVESRHGSLYRLMTVLGKRAGQRLNQPV